MLQSSQTFEGGEMKEGRRGILGSGDKRLAMEGSVSVLPWSGAQKAVCCGIY